MQLTTIPLSRLVPSPLNVRKTNATNVAELAASIAAHGLMQNLTVIERGEQFGVVAGGMRLRALQDLAKRKLVESDHLVPCNVVQAEEAHEASLTENVTRSAMHPADEFEAFNALASGPEKKTTAEIATRFGKSELYVQQRMKLANVAPELLKEYRAGKATLEQLMALALTDDHNLQRRVWKAARGEWQRSPVELRKILTKQEISTESSLGAFVGVTAHEEAGGRARWDLFDRNGAAYMGDVELVRKVALEKLERTAEKVAKEGWKWVEARSEFDYSEQNKFGRVYPNYKGGKESWTDKEKAQAGVVVTIGHNGQTDIRRGLVRPEDRRSAEKSSKAKVSGGKKVSDRKPGELAFVAIQRLQAEGGAIVAAEVAKSPDIALKLLAAELVNDVFYSLDGESQRTWTHIGREHTNRMPGIVHGLIDKTAAAQGIEALEAGWRQKLPKKRKDARAWIFEQDAGTVLQLLAFLVAREIDVVAIYKGASKNDGIVELAAAASVDLAKHWKPTAEWLATLPKSTILLMVKDNGAKDIDIAKLAKLPKAELPKEAILHFQSGWLPEPLRPAIARKKPSAKKAAKKAKRAA